MLAIAALLMLLVAVTPSCTNSINNLFVRASISASGGLEEAPEIVIVEIDDRSLTEKGSWPWNKQTFARLIKNLSEANSRLIMLDSQVAAEADLRRTHLAKRRADGPIIVMGYDFYPELVDMPKEDRKGRSQKRTKDDFNKIILPSKPSDDSKLLGMSGIDLDYKASQRDSAVEGFSNIFPNSNGVVMRHPLAVRFNGMIFPALPVVVLSKWRGFTPIVKEDTNGRPTGLSIGDDFVHTGHDAGIDIGFRGTANSFPHISATDVIEGRIDNELLSGKIVLIGLTSNELGKFHDTSVGRMNDIEITANILDNILHDRAIKSLAGRGYTVLFLAIAGLIFAFIIAKLSQWKRLVSVFTLLIATWVIGFAILWNSHVLIPTIQLSIAIVLFTVALALWKFVAIDMPRRKLLRLFSHRMNRSTIEDIVSDPSLIESRGHEIEITAFAIDIKGFGAIADKLGPAMLTKFVEEYHRLVTDVLLRHAAMIESWIGDDIRAVFGAPVPFTEHALRACLAALDLRRKISSNHTMWSEKYGIARFRIGVGIQTGTAVAGDLGSGYNVIGGAMEAACQLRSQNRLYRTWALVGESTQMETKSAMQYRTLDPVYLWGEKNPVVIHELIGDIGTILPSIKGYDEARQAYLEGDFDLAVQLFKDILDAHPHDGPSQLLLRRAVALRRNPPEAWNGVWRR